MKPAAKLRLAYIHSSAHSGSTLLALQLARHPEVGTVGELSGTRHRAAPGYQCSCRRELVQCDFWRQVAAAMAKRGFAYSATTAETDIRNTRNPLARRLLRPMHRGPLLERLRDAGLALTPGGRAHLRRQQALKTALVESVIECTGKPLLVDSSKSGLQLKYHLRNPRLDVKVLWLVRDGRGTSLSMLRTQNLTLPRGAYDWRRANEEAEAIVRTLDRSRWIQLRYEALCSDPERTLSAAWKFIGVEPLALDSLGPPPSHVLGHPSRLSGRTRIERNEKWRAELSADDLRLFETVAGPLNRQLGYR